MSTPIGIHATGPKTLTFRVPTLDTALRALLNEPRGFQVAHPTLVDWLPIDIGHAAKVLIAEGLLVKLRCGHTGRMIYRGAHLPKPRRSDAGTVRVIKAARVPRTTSGERIVTIARRLGQNPKGFRSNDPAFDGVPPSSVGCSLQHMTKRQELFKVRVSHKLVLFFGSQADAEASIKHFQAYHIALKPQNVVTTISPHHRVDADAPADFSRARLVVCPSFTPRNVALDVLCPLLRQAPYRRAA